MLSRSLILLIIALLNFPYLFTPFPFFHSIHYTTLIFRYNPQSVNNLTNISSFFQRFVHCIFRNTYTVHVHRLTCRQPYTCHNASQRRRKRSGKGISRLSHLRRHKIHTHRIKYRLRTAHHNRGNQSDS